MAKTLTRPEIKPIQKAKKLHEINWKDEEDVGMFISKVWDLRSTHKWPFEREWLINIAWFAGDQTLQFEGWSDRLNRPAQPSWRVRLVANLLLPVVRTALSKTLRNDPIWDVTPATSDQEDITLAGLQKDVLTGYWKSLGMPTRLVDGVLWALTTGNCFFKEVWDPNAGQEIDFTFEDFVNTLPEQDEEVPEFITAIKERFGGLPTPGRSKAVMTGDMKVVPCNPFTIIPDYSVDNFMDAQWVLESKFQTMEKLIQTYGEKAVDGIEGSKGVSTDPWSYYQRQLKSYFGPRGRSYSSEDELSGLVLVHELYKKPLRGKRISRRSGQRDGVHAVFAQNKKLKLGPFPYDHGELPFTHVKEIGIPGKLWGMATIEQLRPLQADYNESRSQLAESRNLMSKPKWTLAKGSGVAKNAITSEPGEVIEHNHGMAPVAVTPPSLPGYISDLPEFARRDFQDISGQHEVSRAQTPGSVRAGIAIAALQEQDDTQLGPFGRALDEGLKDMGRKVLATLRQFVQEPRLVKMVGNNREIEIRQFLGEELVGPNEGLIGIDYFDVNVQTFSNLPLTRSGQQQVLELLLQYQILDPQRDRDLIVNLTGLGTTNIIFDESRADRNRAAQENVEMQNGQQVEAKVYDNHAIHMASHSRFRKMKQGQIDEEVFEAHVNMHLEKQAEQALIPQIVGMLTQGRLMQEAGIPPQAVQGQNNV